HAASFRHHNQFCHQNWVFIYPRFDWGPVAKENRFGSPQNRKPCLQEESTEFFKKVVASKCFHYFCSFSPSCFIRLIFVFTFYKYPNGGASNAYLVARHSRHD